MKDDVDDEWNKYLEKYYLNIRKVKPIMIKEGQTDAFPT